MAEGNSISAKERVERLLKQLPPDCSLEDIQYHLSVMQLIEERTRQADAGEIATPAQVEGRLSKWIIQERA